MICTARSKYVADANLELSWLKTENVAMGQIKEMGKSIRSAEYYLVCGRINNPQRMSPEWTGAGTSSKHDPFGRLFPPSNVQADVITPNWRTFYRWNRRKWATQITVFVRFAQITRHLEWYIIVATTTDKEKVKTTYFKNIIHATVLTLTGDGESSFTWEEKFSKKYVMFSVLYGRVEIAIDVFALCLNDVRTIAGALWHCQLSSGRPVCAGWLPSVHCRLIACCFSNGPPLLHFAMPGLCDDVDQEKGKSPTYIQEGNG